MARKRDAEGKSKKEEGMLAAGKDLKEAKRKLQAARQAARAKAKAAAKEEEIVKPTKAGVIKDDKKPKPSQSAAVRKQQEADAKAMRKRQTELALNPRRRVTDDPPVDYPNPSRAPKPQKPPQVFTPESIAMALRFGQQLNETGIKKQGKRDASALVPHSDSGNSRAFSGSGSSNAWGERRQR